MTDRIQLVVLTATGCVGGTVEKSYDPFLSHADHDGPKGRETLSKTIARWYQQEGYDGLKSKSGAEPLPAADSENE